MKYTVTLYNTLKTALKTNDHEAIRTIKVANPDLTLYSDFGLEPCWCACPAQSSPLMHWIREQDQNDEDRLEDEDGDWLFFTQPNTIDLLYELKYLERTDIEIMVRLMEACNSIGAWNLLYDMLRNTSPEAIKTWTCPEYVHRDGFDPSMSDFENYFNECLNGFDYASSVYAEKAKMWYDKCADVLKVM
jgi:hypothetical protein